VIKTLNGSIVKFQYDKMIQRFKDLKRECLILPLFLVIQQEW
jgi:hypothetical protein